MQEMPCQAGDIVRARQHCWRVIDVRPFDDCRLLTLAGTTPANWDVERRLLEPFDDIERIGGARTLRRTSIGRWRVACRQLLSTTTEAGGLRTAHAARIDLLPHQLEPALALIRGLGCRVLLADEVGLGKTIQAALVAAELRRRGAADRVLILTPAGLRDQWSAELQSRFCLDAAVLDARSVRDRLPELPVGVNPWATVPVAIASIDYVKRPEVLPAVLAARWDLVIVDEAHAIATDSDRHRAVRALAERAAWVVLVTATPHSGDADAFARLTAIGSHGDRLLVFRRTRDRIRHGSVRRVHRLRVRLGPQELRLHRALDAFAHEVRTELGNGDEIRLALEVLYKRACSSAWSLAQTVERRLRTLSPSGIDTPPEQLALPLDHLAGEIDPADEAPPWPARLSFGNWARERHLLGALGQAARDAAAFDSKGAALARLLARIDEPVIVFTEFRDTLLHIRDTLGRSSGVLHGGLSRHERRNALSEFVEGRRSVLLATDAAGEGLNLHYTCRIVINLELPWNPVRLEQRLGRVDRIGQTRTVHAFHLISRATAEQRVLDRLRARIANANGAVGLADPLGERREAPSPAESSAFTVLDLSTSAAGEARRVERSRSLARPISLAADSLEPVRSAKALSNSAGSGAPARVKTGAPPTAACLTRTRNPATRALLGSHWLAIFRIGCVDGRGREIEATLIAFALNVALPRRRVSLSSLLACLTRRCETAAQQAVAAWCDRVARNQRAWCACRLARERDIERTGAIGPDPLYQPGLFDRRAERERHTPGAIPSAGDHQHRVATLEAEARVTPRAPELQLVLET